MDTAPAGVLYDHGEHSIATATATANAIATANVPEISNRYDHQVKSGGVASTLLSTDPSNKSYRDRLRFNGSYQRITACNGLILK